MCEQFIGDFIYRDSEFTPHCRIAAKTNLLLLFRSPFYACSLQFSNG